MPATIGGDVILVRAALLEYLRAGHEEIQGLRWHGAKATLTSMMQILGISPRAVRFAGDWGSKDESMADTYMNKAQLLVLKAQDVLAHSAVWRCPLGPRRGR